MALAAGPRRAARKRHHPWIYRQAIAAGPDADAAPGLARIDAADGTVVGWGFPSPDSLIAVRLVSFSPEPPEVDWLERRIAAAVALRGQLSIDSDAVRLVNAEGDFLPGLVADRYADTVVVSLHAKGMAHYLPRIAEAFAEDSSRNQRLSEARRAPRAHRGARSGVRLPRGSGNGQAVISECGVKTVVDFAQGQKTGDYLDLRASRSACAAIARGRSVLNLFSYTGAFSLRAAGAGAARVVSVESSKRALEQAAESERLNPGILLPTVSRGSRLTSSTGRPHSQENRIRRPHPAYRTGAQAAADQGYRPGLRAAGEPAECGRRFCREVRAQNTRRRSRKLLEFKRIQSQAKLRADP